MFPAFKLLTSSVITDRKRSLGQGNIFIGVCQEFCSQGGGCVCSQRGCLLWGVSVSGGVCLGVSALGVSALGGYLLLRGVCSGGGCLLGGCLLWGGGLLPGGCLFLRGVCSQGVSALGGVCSGGCLVETPQWILLRVVRILLECILVYQYFRYQIPFIRIKM